MTQFFKNLGMIGGLLMIAVYGRTLGDPASASDTARRRQPSVNDPARLKPRATTI